MAVLKRYLYGLIGLACVTSSIAAEPVVLHTQVVVDQQGFQEEALRLLVPNGWRFDGGVTWDVNRFPANRAADGCGAGASRALLGELPAASDRRGGGAGARAA